MATARAGPRARLALTAGAVAKDPPAVEPNEDALLVAARAERTVVAVLDGAGGFGMAAAALAVIEERLDELLHAPAALPEVWTAVGDALSATGATARRAAAPPTPR